MGHWYNPDGSSCYELPKKGGGMRGTTLGDAKKLGLLPSVSTIIQDVVAKPFVERWIRDQYIGIAIKKSRQWSHFDDEKLKRMTYAAYKEFMGNISGRGDEIHDMFETGLSGGEVDPHIEPALNKILSVCGKHDWSCEVSMAYPLGYGGKPDAFCDEWVIDFKTRDLTGLSSVDKIAYDENAMQLSAYNRGMGGGRKTANVYIDRTDPALVLIKVWSVEEEERAWQMFSCAFEYWKVWKKYNPSEVIK